MFEAFYAVYLWEIKLNIGSFNDTPELIYKIYRGEFENDTCICDFATTDNRDAMDLRNSILKAFRTAFHISYEAMIIMGPDEYSDPDFMAELSLTEKSWFLGSEEHLWNTAIKMNLPNLEWIIKNKEDNSYKGHRLKLAGKGAKQDSDSFYLYELRSELVRGIWSNMVTELNFYANSNDERYSIQADKNLLRNLLVSLNEPPFGYPVYTSGPQLVLFGE